MTFNRDWDSNQVRDALSQECRDMRSDDSVTTAERLRAPFKEYMKQRYKEQYSRRIHEDQSHNLLNTISRQQQDEDGSHAPLIQNLCSGSYYGDKTVMTSDGRRIQHREIEKPHGLAKRTRSIQTGSTFHLDPERWEEIHEQNVRTFGDGNWRHHPNRNSGGQYQQQQQQSYSYEQQYQQQQRQEERRQDSARRDTPRERQQEEQHQQQEQQQANTMISGRSTSSQQQQQQQYQNQNNNNTGRNLQDIDYSDLVQHASSNFNNKDNQNSRRPKSASSLNNNKNRIIVENSPLRGDGQYWRPGHSNYKNPGYVSASRERATSRNNNNNSRPSSASSSSRQGRLEQLQKRHQEKQQQNQQEQTQQEQQRSTSRLGMTFGLRKDKNQAPNPAALEKMKSSHQNQNRENVPHLEVAGQHIDNHHHENQEAEERNPYVEAVEGYNKNKNNNQKHSSANQSLGNSARSTHTDALNHKQVGKRPQGQVGFGFKTNADQFDNSINAIQQEEGVQKQQQASGRSNSVISNNSGRQKVVQQQRDDSNTAELIQKHQREIAILQQRLAQQQAAQQRMNQRPVTANLVPAVANPRYTPTSVERERNLLLKNQQHSTTGGATTQSQKNTMNKASHFASISSAYQKQKERFDSQRRSSSRGRSAHHPDGQLLTQYDEGVVDHHSGSRILAPNEVPKVGYVNLNAIVDMPDARRIPYGVTSTTGSSSKRKGAGGNVVTTSAHSKGRQFFY